MCKAIDKVLDRDKPKEYLEDYEDIADAINYGYYNKEDKEKDDLEIGMQKGNDYMMQVVIDKNSTIDKETLIIKSLEVSIEQDKARNDLKSLKYHTMALEEHKKIGRAHV